MQQLMIQTILSNRRVRTVGEQLANQFSIGLARMSRTIRERMNVRDNEVFQPTDLINAKTISSVINSFFGTNPLSQFMDQTNPLAEVTHKTSSFCFRSRWSFLAKEQVSKFVMFTIHTMVVCALQNHLKVLTLV